MMRSRTLLPLLLVSLWSASAAAQSDADRATARALSAEGHEALEKKDYTTAADRFARADGLVHAPTLSLGLARARAGLGKLVSAQETYRRIVREGVPKGAPAPFFKALDAAKKESEALEPRIPSLLIEIKGPSGATVTIDDVEVPALALGVKRPTDPGARVVRATAPGHRDAEARVTLTEGAVVRVSLELQPAPSAPPAATPATLVSTDTPHPPPSTAQRKAGIALIAVGGAGLALGAVMGGLAIGKHGTLKSACTLPGDRCPQQSKGDLDAYDTFGLTSTIGFVAGGAIAATGLVVLLTAPKSSASRTGWIVPVIGVGYAGATGSF